MLWTHSFHQELPPQNYHLQPICGWFSLFFYWAKLLFVGPWSFGLLGLRTQNFNEGRGCSSWHTDGHGSGFGPLGKVILPNERSDSLPPKCLGWFWNEQIGLCQPRIISEMIWGVRFLSQIFFQRLLLLWGCWSRSKEKSSFLANNPSTFPQRCLVRLPSDSQH